MKKNLGLIILIAILVLITAFLAYTVISKQDINKNKKFNIVEGQVIKFDQDNITARILNIASTLCDNKDTCIDPGEIEVSIQIDYNDSITNYTLKSNTKSQERIKKSNYYINLKYENERLELFITEK